MWWRRSTILFLRCALYALTMAFLLSKLYGGFKPWIELGRMSEADVTRHYITMTLILVFVALIAWTTTSKLRDRYGKGVTILISGLLNGAGLFLFTVFCLGTIPLLAWNTRFFFVGEEGLAFFFFVIPLAVATALIIEAATISFIPKAKIDPADASWRDRPTLKL